MNKFDPLATQMHDLFESCKKAVFTDEQAFELTKTIVLWQSLIGHQTKAKKRRVKMSVEYDNYLNQHRANVYKGFVWITDNLPEILNFRNNLDWQTEYNHDRSKK